MFKELLIAGLVSSVASTDNHLTTHYKNNTQYENFLMSSFAPKDTHSITHYRNNTQYEQLNCGRICKENDISGTTVAYIHLTCGSACKRNNPKDTLTSYAQYDHQDVFEPMGEFLDQYKPMVLDLINKSTHNQLLTSNYYEYSVDLLRHKTFEGLHKNPANMDLEYVSFHITPDGLLTFSKPLQLKH